MAIIQSEGQLEWVERNRYLFINRKYLNDSLMSTVGGRGVGSGGGPVAATALNSSLPSLANNDGD